VLKFLREVNIILSVLQYLKDSILFAVIFFVILAETEIKSLSLSRKNWYGKMKFNAVIFDMDGVLIDSEPFWHEVEKAIFLREGVVITEEMCVSAQGKKSEHVIDEWIRMFPVLKKTSAEYAALIEREVRERIKNEGRPIDGVLFALDFLKKSGARLAVASSSKYHLIYTVLDKLGIRKYFDAVHSSEDEKFGKPHPDVFLSAAKKLGAAPYECLVIEDSYNGVLAAKNAEMQVVAIPGGEKFGIADFQLKTLNEITKIW
jgi:sugar-phosphatase